MTYNHMQVFAAEIVGTFILVTFGNGGICNALLPGTKGHGIGFLGIAFCFGWGVFVALQCMGHISGFYNPAVALGGAVIGDISWERMLVCWAAEMAGAFLSGLVLFFTYLPHLQPLELVYGEESSAGDCCDLTKGKVAVIRQELEGSAKRYASMKNLHAGQGVRIEPERSRGLRAVVLERLCGLSAGVEKEGGLSTRKRVVSSSDLKDLQVKPLSAACESSVEKRVEEDQEVKLVVFCTRPSSHHRYYIFAVWAEFLGTTLLTFTAFAFGNRNKLLLSDDASLELFRNGMEPLLVGLMVFGLILALGGVTGPALNPARDLAPRLVHWLMPIPGKGSSEWWYAWVPVLAPCAGGVVGALLAERVSQLTEEGL